METVNYKNLTFTIWDVGGQSRIRALWRYYYHNTVAVIFVVDSADSERFAEAAKELCWVLSPVRIVDLIDISNGNTFCGR